MRRRYCLSRWRQVSLEEADPPELPAGLSVLSGGLTHRRPETTSALRRARTSPLASRNGPIAASACRQQDLCNVDPSGAPLVSRRYDVMAGVAGGDGHMIFDCEAEGPCRLDRAICPDNPADQIRRQPCEHLFRCGTGSCGVFPLRLVVDQLTAAAADAARLMLRAFHGAQRPQERFL